MDYEIMESPDHVLAVIAEMREFALANPINMQKAMEEFKAVGPEVEIDEQGITIKTDQRLPEVAKYSRFVTGVNRHPLQLIFTHYVKNEVAMSQLTIINNQKNPLTAVDVSVWKDRFFDSYDQMLEAKTPDHVAVFMTRKKLNES